MTMKTPHVRQPKFPMSKRSTSKQVVTRGVPDMREPSMNPSNMKEMNNSFTMEHLPTQEIKYNTEPPPMKEMVDMKEPTMGEKTFDEYGHPYFVEKTEQETVLDRSSRHGTIFDNIQMRDDPIKKMENGFTADYVEPGSLMEPKKGHSHRVKSQMLNFGALDQAIDSTSRDVSIGASYAKSEATSTKRGITSAYKKQKEFSEKNKLRIQSMKNIAYQPKVTLTDKEKADIKLGTPASETLVALPGESMQHAEDMEAKNVEYKVRMKELALEKSKKDLQPSRTTELKKIFGSELSKEETQKELSREQSVELKKQSEQESKTIEQFREKNKGLTGSKLAEAEFKLHSDIDKTREQNVKQLQTIPLKKLYPEPVKPVKTSQHIAQIEASNAAKLRAENKEYNKRINKINIIRQRINKSQNNEKYKEQLRAYREANRERRHQELLAFKTKNLKSKEAKKQESQDIEKMVSDISSSQSQSKKSIAREFEEHEQSKKNTRKAVKEEYIKHKMFNLTKDPKYLLLDNRKLREEYIREQFGTHDTRDPVVGVIKLNDSDLNRMAVVTSENRYNKIQKQPTMAELESKGLVSKSTSTKLNTKDLDEYRSYREDLKHSNPILKKDQIDKLTMEHFAPKLKEPTPKVKASKKIIEQVDDNKYKPSSTE